MIDELHTDRLRLRALGDDDAHALLALYGDPVVMRHWIHSPWTMLAQAQAAIDEARHDLASGRALHLAIVTRCDAHVVGSCALFDIDADQGRATIGYLLARPWWGQGMAREALDALVGHGVTALGLQRIEAEVAPDNVASQALLQRLGFRCESRLPGHWQGGDVARDVDLWSLTCVRRGVYTGLP